METIREARPEDAPAIARVTVATWRSTYRGIVPDDVLAGMSEDQSASFFRAALAGERGLWRFVVAERVGGEVVGYAGAREAEEPGYAAELRMLYVLDGYQSRGIGRRLMATVAERLAELGHTSLMLWVLAGNPAAGFYERLGGRVLRAAPIPVMGLTLDSVAYGWPDTAALRSLPDEPPP